MDITFYKLENDVINQVKQELIPEEWKTKSGWVDIRAENHQAVADYFSDLHIYPEMLDCIAHPETYPFSNTFGENIVLNLAISDATNIYKADYVSVIWENELIITIVPLNNDLFNERNISTFSEKKHSSIRNFLFYVLAVKTLAQNNDNLSAARSRLHKLEQALNNDSEEISSNDLIFCERDINQLSDIIEDQYVGFGILTSLGSTSQKKEEIQQTHDTIKGFEPLDKAMQRLEQKAESLRVQYMLIQQEKSTRKINVLTIVQAIFVPLTFIAGVYGMNFVVMPELEWKYGYFIVWLVFGLLAGSLLFYFYRKGWFN